ncbi:hypothetical protein, partial [Thermomonas sp.]
MTVGQDRDKVLRHNRGMLIALIVVFFGGMLIAGLLRFSGWRPEGTKNKGEMLEPYVDLREYAPALAAGGAYRWHDEPRIWRIVVAPDGCDASRRAACIELLREVDTVWQLMGKDADRVHVLWVATPPAGIVLPREVRVLRRDDVLPATLSRGKRTASVEAGDAAWLVDPNGFVVLRYAPGFDPGDLRTDL